MNESLLRSLIKLFAFIVDNEEGRISSSARRVVADFLEKDFNREQIRDYLDDMDYFADSLDVVDFDPVGVYKKIVEAIKKTCGKINSEFEQNQKVWLILQLIEFLGDSGFVSKKKLDLISIIAQEFYMPDLDFTNGKNFILANEPGDMPMNINVILIDGLKDSAFKEIQHIYQPNLSGKLFVLRIASTDTLLVKYFGDNNLFLNSKTIKPGRAYIFGIGSVIRNPRIEPIYYNRISGQFYQSWSKTNIRFTAVDIEYRHKGSQDGVHRFTFDAHSGQLIAIMGGSGVGKSTLINLLNGNLKSANGEIFANGYEISENKAQLKGVMGYVPQDDLLVEDLTVFQNLYYGAKLCFSDKSEQEIVKLVEATLADFDLVEARNLKVGNPVNKFISGGQRKRLNIAMELIREPAILFVDEPTSGLSSFDSERIVLLLKRQTLKGRIVIANVHQPSSDVYKLFDKVLVMDQGGRVIFQGNPMDAVVYFKTEGQYLKAEESECLCCGNVNTELIFRVIEARVVNEYGKLTRKRKRSAKEWYEQYLTTIQNNIKPTTHRNVIPIPENNFSIPNRWEQSWLFFKRNLVSKFSNRQFMLIALIEAPALALILGFFSKFISGSPTLPNEYVYSNNDNIPSFLFMSVVAIFFMGLTISAEEIIRDQRVRQREKFLNLSYFSYINSKVLTLLIASAIQSFLFTAVGNYILEIQGAFLSTWLILFSSAVCANLIGLNISSALNSVVSIYITIPLILVPMLLMSGVIVSYDKLHRSMLHPQYVPIVGELVPIKWSYEALCVQQYKSNLFNKHFFRFDQELSNSTYIASLVIPRLQQKVEEVRKNYLLENHETTYVSSILLIKNELESLRNENVAHGFQFPNEKFYSDLGENHQKIDSLSLFLTSLRSYYIDKFKEVSTQKDKYYESMVAKIGGVQVFMELKRNNHNNALEELVLNKKEIEKTVVVGDRIYRRYNPIHAIPTSPYGRAHLFAPEKRIGSIKIDTLWFNTLIIWLMTFMLYLSLLANLFRSINKYLERFKFRRLARRIALYIPK